MASENNLLTEDTRVGWFLHERSAEGSAPSPAVLRNEAGRPTLTIPVSPFEEDQTTTRWFTGRSTLYSDDPDFTRYEYRPPSSLIFADPRGLVGLFNCRDLGFKSLLGGAGEGRLHVGFAVFGAFNLDYAKPTHLRTYIPGMGDWVRMSAIEVTSKSGTDGLSNEVSIQAKKVDPIELAPGVTLKTSWHYNQRDSDNWFQIQDPPFVETEVPEGAEFAQHLKDHGVFLELVDLAYWQPTGYNRIQCYLSGDDAQGVAKQWREVETDYVRHQSEKHKNNLNPLFWFGEVGAEGYRRWAALRDKMGKALAPLMTLLDIQDSTLETRFIQSCVGLEGIGVQLLQDDGNYNRNSAPRLKKRLERIVEANGFAFSDDWPERTAKLYNDIKHYDRGAVTDPVDIWNNLLENQLVFRSWAAMQIGVSREAVEDRIQYTSAGQQLVGEPGIYFKDYPKK